MEMPLDGERFEAFLEQHRDWLRRWFMSRCGDLATSEDLVQETALEAWRNRHKFTVSGNQRGWLAAIGNHVFRRWQRSIGRSRISTSPHGSGSEVHIERTQGAFSAHSDESTWLVERQELASFIDCAGAYFPPSELPAPLFALARFLPQTYAIDAVRRLLLGKDRPVLAQLGSLSPLETDLLIIVISAVVTVALGTICFRLGLRKARADGALSRWA